MPNFDRGRVLMKDIETATVGLSMRSFPASLEKLTHLRRESSSKCQVLTFDNLTRSIWVKSSWDEIAQQFDDLSIEENVTCHSFLGV